MDTARLPGVEHRLQFNACGKDGYCDNLVTCMLCPSLSCTSTHLQVHLPEYDALPRASCPRPECRDAGARGDGCWEISGKTVVS